MIFYWRRSKPKNTRSHFLKSIINSQSLEKNHLSLLILNQAKTQHKNLITIALLKSILTWQQDANVNSQRPHFNRINWYLLNDKVSRRIDAVRPRLRVGGRRRVRERERAILHLFLDITVRLRRPQFELFSPFEFEFRIRFFNFNNNVFDFCISYHCVRSIIKYCSWLL